MSKPANARLTAPDRGLLNSLQSLKALLGTDSPEVSGWAPLVRHGAQETVNAAIAELKRLYNLGDDVNANKYGARRV